MEPSVEVFYDSAEAFAYILGLCVLVIAALSNRTLNQMDSRAKEEASNNAKQWKAISGLDGRLSHLEGAHDAQHGTGGRRPYDPEDRSNNAC